MFRTLPLDTLGAEFLELDDTFLVVPLCLTGLPPGRKPADLPQKRMSATLLRSILSPMFLGLLGIQGSAFGCRA